MLDDLSELFRLDNTTAWRPVVRSLAERGSARASGDLAVGFLHYTEEKMAPWTTDETVLDHLNQLALVCRRNRHVAIYLSDQNWRAAVARQFDVKGERGLGALRRIPAGMLNAAFVKGLARTLWLSGINRPSSVKADNKILSGMSFHGHSQ